MHCSATMWWGLISQPAPPQAIAWAGKKVGKMLGKILPTWAPICQRDLAADICSLENFIESISITSFWGFISCLHVWVCFWILESSNNLGTVFFAGWTSSKPFPLQGNTYVAGLEMRVQQTIKQSPGLYMWEGQPHNIQMSLNRHFLRSVTLEPNRVKKMTVVSFTPHHFLAGAVVCAVAIKSAPLLHFVLSYCRCAAR